MCKSCCTAPAGALARSNFRNLRRDNPAVEIRITANAEAVPAALDRPDPDADPVLALCENSLGSRGLAAPSHLAEVGVAIRALAELQQEGWIYIRA